MVIDGTSANGPFLNKLSGADRVVITATKSGNEMNFARLGGEIAGLRWLTRRPISTRTARSRC
ncbi:MAG: hypothetical protein U0835_16935 [Isosphaeraceae bacterium]